MLGFFALELCLLNVSLSTSCSVHLFERAAEWALQFHSKTCSQSSMMETHMRATGDLSAPFRIACWLLTRPRYACQCLLILFKRMNIMSQLWIKLLLQPVCMFTCRSVSTAAMKCVSSASFLAQHAAHSSLDGWGCFALLSWSVKRAAV